MNETLQLYIEPLRVGNHPAVGITDFKEQIIEESSLVAIKTRPGAIRLEEGRSP